MKIYKFSRSLLFFCCLVLILIYYPFYAICQEKVIDKSGKTPNWINSTQKDFIIESGKGASIDEAKDRALINIKESIVKSVAEKITSTSEDKTMQERQGNSYKISGNYQSVIRSKTADLPFIKGISLNKVSDFYWEKLKDKKSGSVVYSYYLKYPFSDFELQNIILDYEMSQKKLTEGLNDAIAEIDDLPSIEQIFEKMQTLRGIVPQLDETDKGIASMNIVKLGNILKSITVEEIDNQKGMIKYFLTYGNRHLKTSLKPKINSNCATNFRISQYGDTITLNYESADCFEAVSNSILVEYQAGNYSIKNSFPLTLSQNKVELVISGTLLLKSVEMDSLTIKNFQMMLPILSKFQDEILVKSVAIEFSGHPIVPFNGLSKVKLNKGLNEITLNGQIPLKRKSYDFPEGESTLVSGSIIFVIPHTGETRTYKFFNEHISINW